MCNTDPDCLKLDELPSNEVVRVLHFELIVEINLPLMKELRPLRIEDSEFIHDLYPANEIESVDVFRCLAEKLPGYGIYTVDGELAAWMVQSYYGAMFSMQTKVEHRRKG
jgi:hypothetical protein